MTSPALAPASQEGSKRFACIVHLPSKALTKSFSGSSENNGSLPSRLRTCSAMARYSKFT
eukprot:CAMPEP_0175306274 /NCGR_PEP_ID=MMETSP0093-20121207/64167_1 /TAXON_ID=311494 /ORGANISM="Alexandrium monilatum, Strain CCMP3105" /LENGTH=59 /DNA_ID=CAMNT_0016602711 /DNA_START=4 /DNA_END=180 /DNA_ORIENTATION=-